MLSNVTKYLKWSLFNTIFIVLWVLGGIYGSTGLLNAAISMTIILIALSFMAAVFIFNRDKLIYYSPNEEKTKKHIRATAISILDNSVYKPLDLIYDIIMVFIIAYSGFIVLSLLYGLHMILINQIKIESKEIVTRPRYLPRKES